MATPLTNTVPAEPVVCVTRDRVPSGWETVERSWTVAELRETWPEGTDDVVDGLLKHIEALRSQLTARDALNARYKAALELAWSWAVRKETHLGYERASGVEHGCVACICAMGLQMGMDHDCIDTQDLIDARTALKERMP